MPWITLDTGNHVLIGEGAEAGLSRAEQVKAAISRLREKKAAGKTDAVVAKAKKGRSSEKAKPLRGEMREARREGTGKDAKIVMADGSKAPDHVTPAMLAPSWTNIKVSVDPKAEVLVTARDEKGRPKMVTSKSYDLRSAAVKFDRIEKLVHEHDEISRSIQQARKDPSRKEEADCTWLMQVQATRPGSDRDTKAKVKAYGATTLEARHVVETAEGVRLRFVGKEGVSHDHLVRDKDLGKMLVDRKNAAGSPDERIFRTNDMKVRAFTAQQDGGKFSPKDFRTSAATRLALEAVRANPTPPKDAKELKARVKVVAEKVSGLLGNKPAEALKSYIHPQVFATWSQQ
ncbi:MAG: hypothetical protein ACLQU5_09565 [Isosphaeraceae bacterium]